MTDVPVETERVWLLPGDHPIPSERTVESTAQILELAEEAEPNDLVITLLIGGGSALLTKPASGISLGDLQTVTESLLVSGAPIHEINAVRKHCSGVKGGPPCGCCCSGVGCLNPTE